MNFFPNMLIPNNIPTNNMDNPMMYLNDMYNKFNDFDNRLKKIEQRLMRLENQSNNSDYHYQEPDNSFYMI